MDLTQAAIGAGALAPPQINQGSRPRGCVMLPEGNPDAPEGAVQALGSYVLIGRSPACHVRLDRRHISATHACLRWTGNIWRLQDLGSTNGTYHNRVRLDPAQQLSLRVGDTVSFGGGPHYRVQSVERPPVAAVPLDGSPPQLEDRGLIVLPSSESPEATLFELESGWVLETRLGREAASDGSIFVVDGRAWRFHCPRGACQTEVRRTGAEPTAPPARTIANAWLSFDVSADEEHVRVTVALAGDCQILDNRACFYLLLTLARTRIDDTRAGIADSQSGWIDTLELRDQLRTTEQQINVDIFRLRRLFSELGLIDAASLIERQRPGKVRIGTGNLSVIRG